VDEALLAAVRRVADEVLAPAAEAVDVAERLPPGHLRALAASGAFALRRGSTPAVVLGAVTEVLAGACGATSFVWQQHSAPLGLVAAAPDPLRSRWLGPLERGDVLGGVCFAHLRRPGPPVLRAVADGDGWRIEGEAPWATSWGMAGVFAVAAATSDDRIVWALVEGREAPGLTASAPLPLAVLRATSTVRLRFDGYRVRADDVLAVQDGAAWRAADAIAGNRLNPAVLGLIASAVQRLRSERDPAPGVADALDERRREIRQQWLELAQQTDADVAELAAHRSTALALATDATTALLAAVGGAGMILGHPAQRLAREAAFYVVQAQTPAGRDRRLRDFGRAHAPGGPPIVRR
jgi:alkylation response protein AidB-like acyl-CoA dehydrogenase